MSPTTRDRIITEATRLFASAGTRATTVAQIEEAVGLRKGSGGVHRYFARKEDLVAEVLDALYRRADDKLEEALGLGTPDLDDVGAYLRELGRFFLRESDDLRDLLLIRFREGESLFERFPQFRQRLFSAMLDPIATDLGRLASHHGRPLDPEAAAFLFLAPLLYHRTVQWLTGETALAIADDQLVEEWARQQEILLADLTGH